MDTEGHMLKRLALVVSVLVVFTFGVTGCVSGSKMSFTHFLHNVIKCLNSLWIIFTS